MQTYPGLTSHKLVISSTFHRFEQKKFSMSYFVLNSPLGIAIFADKKLVLLNESVSEELFCESMVSVSAFQYTDTTHAAVMHHRIERKCIFIY